MSPRPSPSSVRIFTNSFALPDPILSFLGRYCTCFSRCTIATSGRVADLWQAGVGWRESERPASVRPGSALPVATPLHNVHVCVPVPLARSPRPLPPLLSLVLRQRPSDAPPSLASGRASRRSYSTRRCRCHRPNSAMAALSSPLREKHVPIACSCVNIRVGPSWYLW